MPVEEDAKRERAGEGAPEERERRSGVRCGAKTARRGVRRLGGHGSRGRGRAVRERSRRRGARRLAGRSRRSSARGASSTPPTSPAAIAIAFISSKALDFAWLKLAELPARRSASRATRSSCRSPALIGAGARHLLLVPDTRSRSSPKRWPPRCRRSRGRAGPRSPTAPSSSS